VWQLGFGEQLMILLKKKVLNPSSSKVFVVSTFQFSCNFSLMSKLEHQKIKDLYLHNFLGIFGNTFPMTPTESANSSV
jgi:hypothetical protein